MRGKMIVTFRSFVHFWPIPHNSLSSEEMGKLAIIQTTQLRVFISHGQSEDASIAKCLFVTPRYLHRFSVENERAIELRVLL